jgi:hypothetical protein
LPRRLRNRRSKPNVNTGTTPHFVEAASLG